MSSTWPAAARVSGHSTARRGPIERQLRRVSRLALQCSIAFVARADAASMRRHAFPRTAPTSCISRSSRPATSRRRSKSCSKASATASPIQTLLGVTGSGKTYTMANVIARTGRPALVLAPNKTLAAQLYSEFREFFPNNAVEYFVSYYDYYQPEAYVPSRDLYIEKDSLDQRAHRADAAVGDEVDPAAARLRGRRDGLGHLRHRRPVRVSQHDPASAPGRRAVAARRDQAADRNAVPAQRHRLPARDVSRARRRARHLPGGARRERGAASRCSTTRSNRCSCSIR